MAEGKSNLGIAEALSVTLAAVEKHVGRIFGKLGLRAEPLEHRRVLAVLTAAAAGLTAAASGKKRDHARAPARRRLDRERAADRRGAVLQSRETGPSARDRSLRHRSRRRPRRSVVVCPSPWRPSRRLGSHGVLGDVGQRLGDDEVRGRSRQSAQTAPPRSPASRVRRARGQRTDRRSQPMMCDTDGLQARPQLAQIPRSPAASRIPPR